MLFSFLVIYIFIAFEYFVEKPLKLNKGISNFTLIILPIAIVSSLLVGSRPLNAGNDTVKYINYYQSLQNETFSTFFNDYSYGWETDYLYRIWTFIWSNLDVSESKFIYITAFISIFFFLIALKKLFKNDYLLIFLFFYATPAFTALFGNAIRQGLAIPFFLMSLAYFLERKKIKMFLTIISTLFIHNYTGVYLIIILLIYSLLHKYIEKNKIIIFFMLLFMQPLVYFLSGFINRLYTSIYTEFLGSEYFFHYSFVAFLILYIIYRFPNKFKFKREKQLFSVYVIISGLSSIVWFNSIAYGRIIYIGFPFLALYISNLKYFYKSDWVVYLLIMVMLGVGVYFFTSTSVQETLTFFKINEFYEPDNLYALC